MSARSKCSMVGMMSNTASFVTRCGWSSARRWGHARTPVMRAHGVGGMAQLRHQVGHVPRHLRLGVGGVVRRGRGLLAAAHSPRKSGADDREAPRQGRRHVVPHRVGLRVAVQQQQSRAGAAGAIPHGATWNGRGGKGEAVEEHPRSWAEVSSGTARADARHLCYEAPRMTTSTTADGVIVIGAGVAGLGAAAAAAAARHPGHGDRGIGPARRPRPHHRARLCWALHSTTGASWLHAAERNPLARLAEQFEERTIDRASVRVERTRLPGPLRHGGPEQAAYQAAEAAFQQQTAHAPGRAGHQPGGGGGTGRCRAPGFRRW